MTPPSPLRVVVAGGGFAAAELVLALRALAEERVQIHVIAPSSRLPFRVAATGEPFGASRVNVYDLAALAADSGATLRRDTVEAVAPRARRVRLASGASTDYDALVVTVGARARAAVPGATTFRDQRDGHLIRRAVDDVAAGAAKRVVFAAPTGVSWTVPLYELALLTAAEASRRQFDAEVVIATPEAAALEIFGSAISAQVESLLADYDVRHIRGVASGFGGGRMMLASGEAIRADRVVAVPRLVGRRVVGIPADWNGFIATDAYGRVEELTDVFAAGDVTRFAVKQGGLATQQADVIAATLAATAGAEVEPMPVRQVLRARLLAPDGPLFLRAELDRDGRPLPSSDAAAATREAPWWPPAKLFGRHLSPWMAAQSGMPAAA